MCTPWPNVTSQVNLGKIQYFHHVKVDAVLQGFQWLRIMGICTVIWDFEKYYSILYSITGGKLSWALTFRFVRGCWWREADSDREKLLSSCYQVMESRDNLTGVSSHLSLREGRITVLDMSHKNMHMLSLKQSKLLKTTCITDFTIKCIWN